METQATGRSKRQTSSEFYKKLFVLTVGGGVVFWATTIATSLLPIAAEYRASFDNRSWSVQTVWVASLLIGMVIGGCVSYSLLRFFDKIPARGPIRKSVILSIIALAIPTILIDGPRSFLPPGPSDAVYYFLIGLLFNAARFLILGAVIGCLYDKLHRSVRS